MWRTLTALLVAEGFHVIAIDLPGHGLSSSSWPPSSYSIDATIERIAQTLHELGVEDPHVVGNSPGGLIALEFAAQGHARSVTALAPAGFSPPLHLLKAGVALLTNRVSFAREPRRQSSANPGLPDPRQDVRAGAGFAGFLPHAFLARFRSTLTVPATTARGDRDVILDSAGLRQAAQTNSNITWIELPGCGHFPMTDTPAQTAQIILDTARHTQASA